MHVNYKTLLTAASKLKDSTTTWPRFVLIFLRKVPCTFKLKVSLLIVTNYINIKEENRKPCSLIPPSLIVLSFMKLVELQQFFPPAPFNLIHTVKGEDGKNEVNQLHKNAKWRN